MESEGLIAIHNPDQIEARMVIWLGDYDPDIHRPWNENSLAEVRSEAIHNAILSLDTDDETLWTKGGVPQVKAIEAEVGFDIQAKERDEAWAKIQASREAQD